MDHSEASLEKQLQGFRLLKQFLKVLGRVEKRSVLAPSWQEPRRQLQHSQYLSLFLFGLLNPVVRSMRGLCRASNLASVQRRAHTCAISPATFSSAQHLLEVELLREVFHEVARERLKQSPPQPGQVPWRIVDSSVFDVLTRLQWAHHQTHRGQPQSALRLHVSLDVIADVPVAAQVTTAKTCERKVWREHWQAGCGEVGDRNFSQDYGLLRLLERRGGFFVLRLREKQARFLVTEELPVSVADRAAKVVRQAWGSLGCTPSARLARVRVVWVESRSHEQLMLVTNQSPDQLTAAQVSQLYQQRWQVELFFRWLKCILQCRHFLAESETGVAIQLYLALIAAVLIQSQLQRRPSRRLWEILQFYFLGLANDRELQAALAREAAEPAAKAAKKS